MKYILIALLLIGCSNTEYGTSTNYPDNSLNTQIIGKWCSIDYDMIGDCLLFEKMIYSHIYNDDVIEVTTYYVSSDSIFIKDHFVLTAHVNNDTLIIQYFNNKNVRYKKWNIY
jgi:hypothetical protein